MRIVGNLNLQLLTKPYLTFDDVLLLPKYSNVESRTEVDTSQDLWGHTFRIPFISANMDYVTEEQMAATMWLGGGWGILHRFSDWPTQLKQMEYLESRLSIPPTISIGIKDLSVTAFLLEDVVENLFAINIDVAHGHHRLVQRTIRALKSKFPTLKVIAGNVATADGFKFLADSGADAVKVGIGPGSVCTTRTVTGVGVPQLSAIMNVYEASDGYPDVKIIADGGIKNSGDIVKALSAGADYVMLGYLLAGHNECPGEPISANSRTYKPYRGQSIFGSNGFRNTPEGIEGYIPARGPVAPTLQRLHEGLRSGMSYVGARNLTELRRNATFIQVSSGTQLENATRVMEAI